MGFLTSRFARVCWRGLLPTAALLLVFGCGEGGGAPGLSEPPKDTGPTESYAGKGATGVQDGKAPLRRGRTAARSAKGVDPAGPE
jgi:hypothetical protein